MTAPDGLASPDDFFARRTTLWFPRIASVSAGVIFAAGQSGQKFLNRVGDSSV
jgi:hypothetical protein